MEDIALSRFIMLCQPTSPVFSKQVFLEINGNIDRLQTIAYHLHMFGARLEEKYTPQELCQLNSVTLLGTIEPCLESQQQTSKLNEYKQLETLSYLDNEMVLMRCRKCKQGGIKFYVMNTRSADEGATIFCTCACGAKWTM